jgi:hypothetical protein
MAGGQGYIDRRQMASLPILKEIENWAIRRSMTRLTLAAFFSRRCVIDLCIAVVRSGV